MAYATPSDLIVRSDLRLLAEVSAPRDGVSISGVPELLRYLSDGTSTTSYDPDQVAAATAAISRITLALEDATAIIDSNIRGRVDVPLSAVPREIMTYCCDIAYYKLISPAQDSAEARAYSEALKALAAIRDRVQDINSSSSDGISNSVFFNSQSAIFNGVSW